MTQELLLGCAVCEVGGSIDVKDEVRAFLELMFADGRFSSCDGVGVIDPRLKVGEVADALGVTLSDGAFCFIQQGSWGDLLRCLDVHEYEDSGVLLPRYVRLLVGSEREAKSACEFMMFVLYDGRFVEKGRATAAEVANALGISASRDVLEDVARRDWNSLRAESLAAMTNERIQFLADSESGALASRMDGAVGLAVGVLTVAGVITIIISIASGSSAHPSRREGVSVVDDSELACEKL